MIPEPQLMFYQSSADAPIACHWQGSNYAPLRVSRASHPMLKDAPFALRALPWWFRSHHFNMGYSRWYLRADVPFALLNYLCHWLGGGLAFLGATWRARVVGLLVRRGFATHPKGSVASLRLLRLTERGSDAVSVLAIAAVLVLALL